MVPNCVTSNMWGGARRREQRLGRSAGFSRCRCRTPLSYAAVVRRNQVSRSKRRHRGSARLPVTPSSPPPGGRRACGRRRRSRSSPCSRGSGRSRPPRRWRPGTAPAVAVRPGPPCPGRAPAACGRSRRIPRTGRCRRTCRPSSAAATTVVPLPLNGSSTMSPGLLLAWMTRFSTPIGIWQPCQPSRSLNVPQTRLTFHVSPLGVEQRLGRFLRAQVPHVVRQLALGVGPRVAVGRLPGAGHADRVGVERELLLVLREVQDVRVAAGELVLGLLAERVVPDDPVAQVEADLPPGDHARSAAYSSPIAR